VPKYTATLRTPGDIGLAVQQARMAREWSQTDLGTAAGVRQSTVSEIESGKSTIYLRQLLALVKSAGLELTATWNDPDKATGGSSDAANG
jgi:transcriptional regulator with XRE-family HTH domain